MLIFHSNSRSSRYFISLLFVLTLAYSTHRKSKCGKKKNNSTELDVDHRGGVDCFSEAQSFNSIQHQTKNFVWELLCLICFRLWVPQTENLSYSMPSVGNLIYSTISCYQTSVISINLNFWLYTNPLLKAQALYKLYNNPHTLVRMNGRMWAWTC